jgi:hypothetical protein
LAAAAPPANGLDQIDGVIRVLSKRRAAHLGIAAAIVAARFSATIISRSEMQPQQPVLSLI